MTAQATGCGRFPGPERSSSPSGDARSPGWWPRRRRLPPILFWSGSLCPGSTRSGIVPWADPTAMTSFRKAGRTVDLLRFLLPGKAVAVGAGQRTGAGRGTGTRGDRMLPGRPRGDPRHIPPPPPGTPDQRARIPRAGGPVGRGRRKPSLDLPARNAGRRRTPGPGPGVAARRRLHACGRCPSPGLRGGRRAGRDPQQRQAPRGGRHALRADPCDPLIPIHIPGG